MALQIASMGGLQDNEIVCVRALDILHSPQVGWGGRRLLQPSETQWDRGEPISRKYFQDDHARP